MAISIKMPCGCWGHSDRVILGHTNAEHVQSSKNRFFCSFLFCFLFSVFCLVFAVSHPGRVRGGVCVVSASVPAQCAEPVYCSYRPTCSIIGGFAFLLFLPVMFLFICCTLQMPRFSSRKAERRFRSIVRDCLQDSTFMSCLCSFVFTI